MCNKHPKRKVHGMFVYHAELLRHLILYTCMHRWNSKQIPAVYTPEPSHKMKQTSLSIVWFTLYTVRIIPKLLFRFACHVIGICRGVTVRGKCLFPIVHSWIPQPSLSRATVSHVHGTSHREVHTQMVSVDTAVWQRRKKILKVEIQHQCPWITLLVLNMPNIQPKGPFTGKSQAA